MSSFGTSRNKGFHITFPNGVTLSTQFGGGNYGSNYNAPIGRTPENGMAADEVEVAVFNADGTGGWRTQEAAATAGLQERDDDVIGYVGIEDWLKLLDACRALPPSKDAE